MRNYLQYLVVITIALTGVLFVVHENRYPFDPAFTWWLLPLVFFSISVAGHTLMIRSFKGQSDQFMIFFLLATTVKMLLYLGLLLVWFLISGRQLEMSFVGAFALLYVVFTALDLITILKFKKRQK